MGGRESILIRIEQMGKSKAKIQIFFFPLSSQVTNRADLIYSLMPFFSSHYLTIPLRAMQNILRVLISSFLVYQFSNKTPKLQALGLLPRTTHESKVKHVF